MVVQPTRQVHLDFHTSEHIPDVGTRFDKAQFQEALRLGRVNAINIFAKCHHSWSYYPTRVGMVHPALTFDLLGQQIEACHEIGVRCPVYVTVGWSATDAELHPDWVVRDIEGRQCSRDKGLVNDPDPNAAKPFGSWKDLCPSGDYLELILAQSRELCEGYDLDGLWYDITSGPPCYCDHCRRGMAAEGFDVNDPAQVLAYNRLKWRRFMEACNAQLFSYYPEATVFYNGTTVMYSDGWHTAPGTDIYRLNTHYELEDLPTTWGGYDKLSLRAKFFGRDHRPMIAMSGKFHTSWGEFGGFKHPDAIRYEAAAMIAHGCIPCFGDQLHPAGEMDLETYRSIGEAYTYVEQIESFIGAQSYATLGVWRTGAEPDDQGVVNMLLEAHLDYDLARPGDDLSRFEVIILTGGRCLTAADAAQLAAYSAQGGKLLVLGESALLVDRDALAVDIGARYLGPARYQQDYTVAGEALRQDLVASPFLNDIAAIRVAPNPEATVLATIKEPYFDRTYGHYCSHRNTPNRVETAEHPAALRCGNVVFLAHRLGEIYYRGGARVHRQFLINALRLLHERPAIEAELPSAGRVTLMHQPEQRRYIAHLLYAPPLQRGGCLVIEDQPPLHDVGLRVRVPEPVTGVTLAPQGEGLPFERRDGVLAMKVPLVVGHQAVVLSY
ncbi:MAG: alpha-amylase family protein [Anaerolineales bacterium]